MRLSKWILLAGIALLHAAPAWSVEGLGLKPNADNPPWARWQGRIAMGTAAPLWRADLGGIETSGLQLRSLSVVGDYYFIRSPGGAGPAGGFRATSGVIIGLRSRPSADPFAGAAATTVDGAALPYLGIGYTGLSERGGWSVNADLGVRATHSGNEIRLGRSAGGSQGLDDLVREMRLAPVLQLGVSYSF